jgi:predicted ribosome quality control (RQC) complex YloA/Tae2 family protein
MYLDAFTIAALVDEFMDTLVGGRIQDTLDADQTGIGLEIYANHRRQYLYLSADKHAPRVHVVETKLRRGLQVPSQIGLMFRRFVEGSRIEHISQPPYERILQIEVSHPAEGLFTIVVEPMERRSNILLLRDGIILDCMWRVGPDENRYRLSLPNHEYKLPPPMIGRYDPATIALADLEGIFASNTDPKQKTTALLTARILGISPLLAKEIVYRASGNINEKASDATPSGLLEQMQRIVMPLTQRDWQPGIARTGGLVEAYSVYPLTHLPNWQPTETLSQAMETYYGAVIGAEAYNEIKKPVQAAIEEARKKFGAKLASLESGLKDETERNFLQQSGELILAYQYTLEKGQTELRAQYDLDAPELVIKIDPQLTPLENAQRYFDRYNRAKRAQKGVPQLIADTKTELAYLAQLENDLDQAANYPEIDDVIQALQARDLMPKQKMARRVGGGGRSAPLRLTKDGYVIWVGRNSRQNEQVTFKQGNPQDLWLHARDVPGAHVVIRNDGRSIPGSLIQAAASVAAYYSASRSEARAIVDVTRCKYVKKIKGAGPGMVTYRNEETLTVTPHNEEILKDG